MRLFDYIRWLAIEEKKRSIELKDYILPDWREVIIIDASEVMAPMLDDSVLNWFEDNDFKFPPPFIDQHIWVEGHWPEASVACNVVAYRGLYNPEIFYSRKTHRDDVGWTITGFGYRARRSNGTFRTQTYNAHPGFCIYLGEDGSQVEVRYPDGHDETGLRFSTLLTWFVAHTFHFLDNRVEADEIIPRRAEKRQAARAFGQKGTYPLRNYYMLKVKPQKPGYTGPPQPLRQSGIGKRLHAVRGHFRRVPDTGLFGRGDKAGELLWIPNHTRGDSSLGEIVKGYKVEPGDN